MTTVEINGVTYVWRGYFGSIIQSKERGVKIGDTRVIEKTLFYAYSISEKRINWIPLEDVDVGWIERFKAKIL